MTDCSHINIALSSLQSNNCIHCLLFSGFNSALNSVLNSYIRCTFKPIIFTTFTTDKSSRNELITTSKQAF